MANEIKFENISQSEFDKIIPCYDLTLAHDWFCGSQYRNLRHFPITNNRNLTINVMRNEWKIAGTNFYGTSSQLARHLGWIKDEDYRTLLSKINDYYNWLDEVIKEPKYGDITIHPSEIQTVGENDKVKMNRKLSHLGFSISNFSGFCSHVNLPKINSEGYETMTVIGDINKGGAVAWNGYGTLRFVGQPGFISFGNKLPNQVVMVYDNIFDFLAIMESAKRRGVEALMNIRYSIITNGNKGLTQACNFLSENPDFNEVRCFMPNTLHGRHSFEEINKAVKGCAIDKSDIFKGYPSLLAKHVPHKTEDFKSLPIIEPKISSELHVGDNKNVGQGMPSKDTNLDLKTTSENKDSITRSSGGIKI